MQLQKPSATYNVCLQVMCYLFSWLYFDTQYIEHNMQLGILILSFVVNRACTHFSLAETLRARIPSINISRYELMKSQFTQCACLWSTCTFAAHRSRAIWCGPLQTKSSFNHSPTFATYLIFASARQIICKVKQISEFTATSNHTPKQIKLQHQETAIITWSWLPQVC